MMPQLIKLNSSGSFRILVQNCNSSCFDILNFEVRYCDKNLSTHFMDFWNSSNMYSIIILVIDFLIFDRTKSISVHNDIQLSKLMLVR